MKGPAPKGQIPGRAPPSTSAGGRSTDAPASFARSKNRLDLRPQPITDNTRANHGTYRDHTEATELVDTP